MAHLVYLEKKCNSLWWPHSLTLNPANTGQLQNRVGAKYMTTWMDVSGSERLYGPNAQECNFNEWCGLLTLERPCANQSCTKIPWQVHHSEQREKKRHMPWKKFNQISVVCICLFTWGCKHVQNVQHIKHWPLRQNCSEALPPPHWWIDMNFPKQQCLNMFKPSNSKTISFNVTDVVCGHPFNVFKNSAICCYRGRGEGPHMHAHVCTHTKNVVLTTSHCNAP